MFIYNKIEWQTKSKYSLCETINEPGHFVAVSELWTQVPEHLEIVESGLTVDECNSLADQIFVEMMQP